MHNELFGIILSDLFVTCLNVCRECYIVLGTIHIIITVRFIQNMRSQPMETKKTTYFSTTNLKLVLKYTLYHGAFHYQGKRF